MTTLFIKLSDALDNYMKCEIRVGAGVCTKASVPELPLGVVAVVCSRVSVARAMRSLQCCRVKE